MSMDKTDNPLVAIRAAGHRCRSCANWREGWCDRWGEPRLHDAYCHLHTAGEAGAFERGLVQALAADAEGKAMLRDQRT